MSSGAKLPAWFRQELPGRQALGVQRLLAKAGLHTVCSEAQCPNSSFCLGRGEATFLILGDTCTRNCLFCAVKKSSGQEELGASDNEPGRIVAIAKELGLRYAVVTSVTRDDLDDGGSGIFAECIRLIRAMGVRVEVLIPDFKADLSSLRRILEAGPSVVAHNLETVSRLYKDLRPQADYSVSLRVLSILKQIQPGMVTKSSLMLGLGETERETIAALGDLRQAGCDILSLGQYLAPSARHYPVKEFISPAQFEKYRKIGYALGFKAIASSPLTRSSYKAGELYKALTC